MRLTLTYGALFLTGGVVLIAITYLLMKHATGRVVILGYSQGSRDAAPSLPEPSTLANGAGPASTGARDSDLHQLLVQSSIALAITTVVALAAGWFVAGRALRPLRTMTATARQISQHNLHERLDVEGPHDEIRDLADTIDALLGRLETAFDAQRRFVANASHELRTPLTWDRALIEVTLADPDATVDTYRSAYTDLLASNEDKEQLIEALLTLASSERGLQLQEPFDLAQVTRESAARQATLARDRGVAVRLEVSRAWVCGHRDLVRRLVDNLLNNAISHNLRGGSVEIGVAEVDGAAVLEVANTGAMLSHADTQIMPEPFQRLGLRTSAGSGHGLGLSIVRAVATAHGGHLSLTPRDSGGLVAIVSFPPADR